MMGKYLGSADQKILWYFEKEYFLNKKYSLGPMCLPTTIIYTKNTLDYKYTI